MNAKLYVVIVTFNGDKWINKCLSSILSSSTSLDVEIVVVDNDSTDDTLNVINTYFTEVVCLPQDQNLGFGKANNIGISYALNKGADYVFLINQDAHIEKDTLQQLVEIANINPKFGVLSPIQCTWDGNALEYYFSKFMMANGQFYSDYVLKHPLETVYQVPFVNAAAWFIPRAVLHQVGGFDPIFKHYGEDNNYCHRLNYHGFQVGVVPNTYIYHDSKKRTQAPSLFTEFYWHQEVKNLQITYANINTAFTKKDFNPIRMHLFKLVLINLITLKFRKVWGYLKKYRIFEGAYGAILESRSKTVKKAPNYLDL